MLTVKREHEIRDVCRPIQTVFGPGNPASFRLGNPATVATIWTTVPSDGGCLDDLRWVTGATAVDSASATGDRRAFPRARARAWSRTDTCQALLTNQTSAGFQALASLRMQLVDAAAAFQDLEVDVDLPSSQAPPERFDRPLGHLEILCASAPDLI